MRVDRGGDARAAALAEGNIAHVRAHVKVAQLLDDAARDPWNARREPAALGDGGGAAAAAAPPPKAAAAPDPPLSADETRKAIAAKARAQGAKGG